MNFFTGAFKENVFKKTTISQKSLRHVITSVNKHLENILFLYTFIKVSETFKNISRICEKCIWKASLFRKVEG